MTARLVFRKTDSTEVTVNQVMSFNFRKEAYQPYTALTAAFQSDDVVPFECTEVLFYLNNKLIHHGIIDDLTVAKESFRSGTVSSRSFTSMLLQNQLEPGLYSGVSINNLMDNMVYIPYVTHEDSDDQTGYIYVKYGSVLWDGIANLSYKQLGTYPYIRGTNCVMFSQYSEPAAFTYSDILSYGTSVSEKRMCSHFHMANMRDEYGDYDYTDSDVIARKITRHRYFEIDKQYLYDPPQALTYRDKYLKRGWRRNFITYSGYQGEDLGDTASFPGASEKRITGIRITGKSSGITTEISVYRDGFYGT